MSAEKAAQHLSVMDAAAERERSVTQPQPGNIVNVIERVLMDPSISIDRLERMLELQKEARTEAARVDFNTALAAAQNGMRVVVADKDNKQTRSRYASYAALDAAVRPIYTEHGFAVTFNTDDSPKPEHVRIIADVSRGAHERRYSIDMPADGKGAKGGDVMTKTHAVMSAASYGKRGLLILIFNIPVADKWDDDGNAAGGNDQSWNLVTDEQVEKLRVAMQFKGLSVDRFLRWAKVDAVEDLPAADFDQAMRVISNSPETQR